MKKKYAVETGLVHCGQDKASQGGFVNPPLYRGSTVLYESVAAMEEINSDPLKLKAPAYGRFGNPNSRAFESALTELEGGFGTVLTNSGLSAVTTTIMSLVKTGDHILISDSCYYPTRNFCNFLSPLGIETEYYDPEIGSGIESKIRVNTRLVFMESPGSISFEVQDVPAIASVCKKKGITTIIDNTWATPLFFKPLLLGVDISIHAATKYITGHADSFLGAIICNEANYPTVRAGAIKLGQCAGAEDVHRSLRGLRTLSVRLRAHEQQALVLAEWLSTRPEVQEVLHPALPGSRGHDIWKRDFTGASGLFAIILKPHYKKDSVDAMINSLKIFGLGHSWGGFESLVLPGHPETFRLKGSWQGKGALIRIHVGLENLEDLKADLDLGFVCLNRP